MINDFYDLNLYLPQGCEDIPSFSISFRDFAFIFWIKSQVNFV